MPKESEITSTGCHVYNSDADYGTCNYWLVENLNYYDVSSYSGSGNTDKYREINYSNRITNIYGYWLLSSHPGSSNLAYNADSSGVVAGTDTAYTNRYGLRPVITVPKADF